MDTPRATRDSLGTQFLIKAIAASAKLWSERYKLRDKATRRRHGMNMADYLKSLRGRNRGNESEDDVGSGGEEPQEDQAEEDEDPAAEPQMMEL